MTEQPSDLLPSPVLAVIWSASAQRAEHALMGEVTEQPFPRMLPAQAEHGVLQVRPSGQPAKSDGFVRWQYDAWLVCDLWGTQ